MRAHLTLALLGMAVVWWPQTLVAETPADAAQSQETMGPDSPAASATKAKACPGNPNPLGVSRVVEIDTTGGPGFGFQHYKAYDFLNPKEVVLTFDDGPLPNRTTAILDALDAECTKATFFSVGKVAAGYPEILRAIAKSGHTIGAHTVNHKDLSKMPIDQAKDEIERSISIIRMAAGAPTAPFFRYPYLRDSPETLKYLSTRNIAVFSTDIDSFDFKRMSSNRLVQSVMHKLEKHGKGIILMHDIQPHTAKALPDLLKQLKAKGYKVVQLTPAAPVKTLPQYDALVKKDVKGFAAGSAQPMSSVVRTIRSE